MLARKHVISITLVLNDIFHCCPMISTLITLVSILATPLEYRTYLVVLHTMEYMINPNTKVCGIFIMYFAHRCFWDTESCKNSFPCDFGKNYSLSFLNAKRF